MIRLRATRSIFIESPIQVFNQEPETILRPSHPQGIANVDDLNKGGLIFFRFFHQIFELTDDLYQRCRMKFSSKRNMWECLREVIRILLFPDWETLLKRVISPMEFL